MRRFLATCALLALFLPASAAAQTALHTGIDSSGDVLDNNDEDPRWKVDGAAAEVTNARGGWLDDDDVSKWLDVDDGGWVSISFDLSVSGAASARIDGRLTVDDYIEEIELNDSSINVPNKLDRPNDDPWDRWVDFTIESGFEAGTNTLRFQVVDTGRPGGFRAQLDLTTSSGFEFDETCVPSVDQDLNLFTPVAFLMLDLSGSMEDSDGQDIDADGMEDTRIEIAQYVVDELATANHAPGPCTSFNGATCDPVQLGLGYYSGNILTFDGLQANVAVSPGEDSGPAIAMSVAAADMNTGGGTPTDDAVERTDRTLSNPSRPNFGIVITDGRIDADGGLRRAIETACDMRSAGKNLFMVGLGPGTDQAANSAIAAGGGTGQCCEGGSAPCGVGEQIDPCTEGAEEIARVNNTVVDDVTCTGSIEADASSLKSEIDTILLQGECTFRLDVPPAYPGGKAYEDPAGTRVRIKLPYLASGWVDVPNVADPGRDLASELEAAYGGSGSGGSGSGGGGGGTADAGTDASFSDATTDASTPDAAATDASTADGGTAGGTDGEPESRFAFLDGEGWEFVDSDRDTIRFSDELCKLIRVRELTEVNTQLACACNKSGNGCSFTLDDDFIGLSAYQLERLRCTEGAFECVNGRDRCSGTANALPEICNGFDDNCDGLIDNMSDSRPDWEPYVDDEVDPEGLNCGYSDSCSCDEPAHYDEPSAGSDIEDHKDSWSGTCGCVENLSPPMTPATPIERGPSGEDRTSAGGSAGSAQAACSAAGGDGTLPGLLVLALFGLFSLRRRGH